MNRRRALSLLVLAALTGAIAFFALRPSPYLQYIPWMPRHLGVWADSHGVGRNVVAFFVLGLAAFAVVGRSLGHVLAVCAFATAVEVAQIWIPSRAFDWKDIGASLLGIALAWPLAWLLTRRRSA